MSKPPIGSSAGNPWWDVYYYQDNGAGSVQFRYTGQGNGGGNYTVTNYTVQAANKNAAIAAAKSHDPNFGTLIKVTGPFKTSTSESISSINQNIDNALNQQYNSNLPNPLSGLTAVGHFFDDLTSASLWERIGEVVFGIILISVGVAQMTKVVPVATKIASVVK